MKITASLSIGRRSDGLIIFSAKDDASLSEFFVAEMTPNNFAMMITGLSFVETPCEVRGLDIVGKTKIRESRTVVCPLKSYDRKALEQWLIDNCQEDGWLLDKYLGSQTSTFSTEGGTGLNYAVYRYQEIV